MRLAREDPQFAQQLESMLTKTLNYPDPQLKSDGFDYSTRSREENDLGRESFAAEPLVRLDPE